MKGIGFELNFLKIKKIMSFQAFLKNMTPFQSEIFVLPDLEGQEVLLVVVVASFETNSPELPLQLANEQNPVRVVDEHYGDPVTSSIQYEGNLVLEKPFVDLIINAQAYAPEGRPTSKVPVAIELGDIRKALLVQGDRHWVIGPLGKSTSNPEKFLTMPIVYERAFGGIDSENSNPKKRRGDLRNPIGVGFQGALSHNDEIQTQVPNVEYHTDKMSSHGDQPVPAGFGAISRNWQPRLAFAGTYDEYWLNEQWPFLPADFDPRFNQTAPPDQQSETIQGGEEVLLVNMTPGGQWRFKLPQLDIPVHLFYQDYHLETGLRLDTVLIEPDLYKVTMTSRLKIQLPRNQSPLREIVLGHMLDGWLRAKVAGKEYIDYRCTDGVDPGGRSFHL